MRRLILLFVLLCGTAVSAQPPTIDGQNQQQLAGCAVVHNDAAVNTSVTIATPTPPAGQFVYVCGIDLSVSNDGTGAVTQANVKFTSANFNNWTYEYSSVNAANTNGLDKSFYPPFAMKAQKADAPVVITSPAANTHAAYSINVYYTTGP